MGYSFFGKQMRFGHGFRRGGSFGRHFDEGGPRQRQRRGDIKFVLLELLKDEPHHGYELIKALEQRSGGFYRPSPGMIYPTLQLLEEEGNLTSKMVDDKRVYSITEAGRKVLAEHEADSQERGSRGRGFRGQGPETPQLMALRKNAMALLDTVMQVARHGTPEQLQAVQTLLNKANQDIHAVMANRDDGAKL